MESNEFDGAFKKKAPNRAPRRRQAAQDEDPDSSVPTAPAGGAAKKSGWGADSPERAGGENGGGEKKPGRRRAADDDDDAEEAPTRHNIASMDDDDDAAPSFIPDLEDEEEDLGRQVAVAPSLKTSRVQTIMELDEEIDLALPASSEVGVDLSVLQSFLTPLEHCQEDDVTWDVEHELQTIASEMQREREEREGAVLPGQMSPKRGKAAKAAEES